MSLETIAPQWAKKIKTGNLNPTRYLSLAHPDKCIRGEAGGLAKNQTYYIKGANDYCLTCKNAGAFMFLAAATPTTITDKKYVKTPLFEKRVRAFEKHWNTKHARVNTS